MVYLAPVIDDSERMNDEDSRLYYALFLDGGKTEKARRVYNRLEILK